VLKSNVTVAPKSPDTNNFLKTHNWELPEPFCTEPISVHPDGVVNVTDVVSALTTRTALCPADALGSIEIVSGSTAVAC
jgi:hypothetical protein